MMGSDKLLSLVKLSERSGISRGTLVKYKALEARPGGLLDGHYVGHPRSMRFRTTAIPIFRKLRNAGVKARGRTE